jgi:hypothetical protein
LKGFEKMARGDNLGKGEVESSILSGSTKITHATSMPCPADPGAILAENVQGSAHWRGSVWRNSDTGRKPATRHESAVIALTGAGHRVEHFQSAARAVLAADWVWPERGIPDAEAIAHGIMAAKSGGGMLGAVKAIAACHGCSGLRFDRRYRTFMRTAGHQIATSFRMIPDAWRVYAHRPDGLTLEAVEVVDTNPPSRDKRRLYAEFEWLFDGNADFALRAVLA